MAFTAKDVAALRERTGCGMMDCKKALTEADGNIEKAIELLREKGLAAAAKKAGRVAAEGLVCDYVADKLGVLVEVNSETDFAANSEKFRSFVAGVARTIASVKPADIQALLSAKYDGSDMTVEEMTREQVLTIGENISVRRFALYEGDVVTYIHGGGRIGVLVSFDTDVADKPGFAEVAKDIAMQIAASIPQYVEVAQVPAEVVAKEKEILMAAAMNEGKPANIAEKMVNGRIQKFYKEVCLLEQPFIKDPDISVQKHLENVSKELGGKIKVLKFERFEKGEGIQKREDNFAEEVAKMVK